MRTSLAAVGAALGACLGLLGGLWLVQGLGLVTIDPVACVGDCAPLRGPSAPWAAAGAALLVAGATVAALGTRRVLRARGRTA